MGLAISRQLNGYEAVSQLDLQHLALSDLETRADVQSGAAPASGSGATTWSRKVQVGRIFGSAPHQPKLSDPQHHGRHLLCALLVLGFLVVCKVYLLPRYLAYLRWEAMVAAWRRAGCLAMDQQLVAGTCKAQREYEAHLHMGNSKSVVWIGAGPGWMH